MSAGQNPPGECRHNEWAGRQAGEDDCASAYLDRDPRGTEQFAKRDDPGVPDQVAFEFAHSDKSTLGSWAWPLGRSAGRRQAVASVEMVRRLPLMGEPLVPMPQSQSQSPFAYCDA